MKSKVLRKRFFDYFEKQGHTKTPSSSLIPAQDPTLLFANAGMNQFKDVFLGKEKRGYNRAVSIQKCVRAGGKHNDLDNVGFTKRHLTFFEMMGNFSFGDYFKKDAIKFAWEFLTQDLKLSKKDLHVSIFKTDDESYNIWKDEIGIDPARIHRLGEADNFWQMGDVGPCGPCTEIFIDCGKDAGCKKDTCDLECGCDRYLEIWNLVFMQFDKQDNGELKNLKQTGVDTGMGLERLAVIMQGKDSVFETDLFTPIIKKVEELTGLNYAKQKDQKKAAFHVLADHIRSSTMIIADGGAPSNEGRGYVLRKIIRRAALFAQKLTNKNIFPELSSVVVAELSDTYPELKKNQKLIYRILQSEIEKFAQNLIRGQKILKKYLQESKETKTITGEQTFKLYDTYGFPLELVVLMAQEHGYKVDSDGFEKRMKKQQEQSGKKVADPLDHIAIPESIQTEFTGYDELATTSKIIAIIKDTQLVKSAKKNETVWVLAKKSPYFIVGGGQVPDAGTITLDGITTDLLHVRYINGRIAAQIKVPVAIKVGDTITSTVDETWRTNAMKNHTATHLLQSALIQILGPTIKQSGSLVHPDYLRFDFTYHENLPAEIIKQVEDLVNAKIMENIPLTIKFTTLKDALDNGALAFFGDKYNPEKVRMIKVADFSTELCGGTHVPATGMIGCFKITESTALSAGHRRIFAITGPRALELFQQSFNTVKALSQEFKVKREDVLQNVLKQKEQVKQLHSEIKQFKKQAWRAQLPNWFNQVETIKKIPTHVLLLKDFEHDELKEIINALQQKQPGFYFVASESNAKSIFLTSLHTQLSDAINLKEFSSWLKDTHGLRGGGSKNSLQGGGGKFDANLKAEILNWLKK